ncbi:MAG TPA: patatin-like phospholipase family protein [Flavisolibacter sp.]|jgi:predicted acylesterase/phospholipase RssA|nr:patatin-like phospholipase family protein [Flavisolibacter sp.]
MKWKALILGGGGSIAEFQIGALQVIAERYENFDLYVGIGAGSLNSSLLAQYDSLPEGYKVLRQCWDNFNDTKDLFDVPFLGLPPAALAAVISNQSWAKDSLYGHRRLKKVAQELIDWRQLENKTNWAIELTCLNDGQLYTITNNHDLFHADQNPLRSVRFSLNAADDLYIGKHFHDLVTAGGCVPFLLPPVDIQGKRFVEGGIKDCTPLELAVKAYQLANATGLYTGAEFVVVDNYTHEVPPQANDALDSGIEILMRTIRIMIVEMAQNDIARGKELLRTVAPSASVTLIQPSVEYPLNPMDFSDHQHRRLIRDHGVSRASLLLPSLPPPEPAALQALNGTDLLMQFSAAGDEEAIADKLVEMVLNDQEPVPLQQARLRMMDLLAAPAVTPPTEKPRNLEELKRLMQTARVNGQKMKAVGAGFAFDQITETPGMAIRLDLLNAVWNPAPGLFRNPAVAHQHVEFEAGATVEKLTTYLWQQGRALLNQPGYEGLSFFGAASVGGHGSGIQLAPLCDAIRSVLLLCFHQDGHLVMKRLEPRNGITDPTQHQQQFPTIELVQDDAAFNACKVAVGCLGVVYSLIIETQSSFYLEERRTLENWAVLRTQITAKLNDPSIHSIHIWFNPYSVRGTHSCVLTEYRRKGNRRQGVRGFGVTFGLIPKLGALLLWCMENFPRQLPALLNSSLKATVNHAPVIMPCYEALNFGTPNLVPVHATNCSIPADKAIAVADMLFQLADQRYEKGAYITCPIGFRFTAPSEGFLSPQFGRASCMIELPLIKNTDFALETISAFLELLITQADGRPHWGQRFNQVLTPEVVQTIYPKFQAFKELYKDYGQGSFANKFTAQIGLDV